MKRFLSLTLVLTLLLTSLMVPAYAEDEVVDAPVVETVVVDITSIADGATIAAGTNLTLAADASSLENVKNIDFYANGTKLPGTIVGNKGSIVWYSPAEGVYTISTKVTYNGGATADGNETIKVIATPADASKMKLLWPDGGELVKTGGGKVSYTDEYALFGNQSAKWIPTGNTNALTFTRDEQIPLTWGTLAFVVYSPEDVDFTIRRNSSDQAWGTYQKMENNSFYRMVKSDADLAIHKGYNIYVTDSGTYTGSTAEEKAENEAKFLDMARISITSAAETNDKPVYLVGIYGIAGTMTKPVATPEIPDGAQAVCNAVGTYRINFDTAIYPDTTKVPAVVKDATGNEVEGVTYTYGTNYVDLHLPVLELETEYTVSIPASTILSYYVSGFYASGRQYVDATDFTFSTKDTDCANATPVVKISYPAAGETCVNNTAFAAKLVAGSSAVDSVKFYNGETELEGTVTEMTDGEYWFVPSADVLTAGAATEITAKVLNAEGTAIASASATYTGAVAPEYAVKGIGDGDVIVDAHETSRLIEVVDKAYESLVNRAVSNIAKIEIYKDDVLADTLYGTNTYTLNFDKYLNNKLQIKVYDEFGGLHDQFVYNYQYLKGVKNPASFEENFDAAELASADSATLAKTIINNDGKNYSESYVAFAIENGALKVDNIATGNNSGYIQFKGRDIKEGLKVHYYEFDYTCPVQGWSNDISTRTAWGYGDGDTLIKPTNNVYNGLTDKTGLVFPANAKKTIGILFNYNYASGETPKAIVYINGKEWKRVPLTNFASNASNVTNFLQMAVHYKKDYFLIDNFKYMTYDAAPEYCVKGIYDGAVMVKEEEATRTITVADKTTEGTILTTATGVSKVELLKDGVVVATSAEATPNVCALPNDSYGTFKLEVKVTDIYGETHSFEYNYSVVEGVKNATSFTENFDNFTAESTQDDLQLSLAATVDNRLNLALNNGALTVNSAAGQSWKAYYFRSSDSAIGRKVHYYNFDILGGDYGPRFLVNGTEIFQIDVNPATNTEDKSYFKNNKPTMTVIVDDTLAEPVVTVLLNGKEWKQVKTAKRESGIIFGVYVHPTYGTTIDNFRYSAYDYPAKFGKNAFDDVVEIVPSYSSTEPGKIAYYVATFNTSFTNTTAEAVKVRLFFVVYDAEGRVLHVYQKDHDGWKEGNPDKTLIVTYEPGVFNKVTNYKCHVSVENPAYGKIFTYVVDEAGNMDISPIAEY